MKGQQGFGHPPDGASSYKTLLGVTRTPGGTRGYHFI